MKEYVKTPNEILDYGFDWSKWLATGDRIVTSTWAIDAGLTAAAQANDDTSTAIFLSAGTVDTSYACTNRIITLGGRTAERRIVVRVIDARFA